MKTFKIKDPIYGAVIIVVVNCSQEEIRGHIKKYVNLKELETVKGLVGRHIVLETDFGSRTNLIWLESFKWSIECQGVVAHEILHCAIEIISRSNIYINSGQDSEALAYYFEYLFTSIWQELKPKKKKKLK